MPQQGTLTAPVEELVDAQAKEELREHVPPAPNSQAKSEAESEELGVEPTRPAPDFLGGRLVRAAAKRITNAQVFKLATQRGKVTRALDDLPDRMRTVSEQTRLVLELIDDFKAGNYRDVSWRSLAIASAALVYLVSPADVVPDVVPGLGILDDFIVASLATRLIRKELREYCEFKGYDPATYFG